MNKRTLLVVLWCLLVYGGFGQVRPSVTTRVDKNRILLGEPFHLTLESVIPGGSIVRPLVIDTIPHFEFLEPPRIDTVREASGIRIRGVYTLTSFDSGRWVIPPYYISGQIRSDTIGIDVVFSDFDPTQPYHDIKDILEADSMTVGRSWWWWAAGALLLALVLFMVFRKKKRRSGEGTKDPGAYQQALRALDKLARESADALPFHTALVVIFRDYLDRRHGIRSKQRTTHELALRLDPLIKERAPYERLIQALRQSDFVKFARYQPDAGENRQALEAVRNGIEELERNN